MREALFGFGLFVLLPTLLYTVTESESLTLQEWMPVSINPEIPEPAEAPSLELRYKRYIPVPAWKRQAVEQARKGGPRSPWGMNPNPGWQPIPFVPKPKPDAGNSTAGGNSTAPAPAASAGNGTTALPPTAAVAAGNSTAGAAVGAGVASNPTTAKPGESAGANAVSTMAPGTSKAGEEVGG